MESIWLQKSCKLFSSISPQVNWGQVQKTLNKLTSRKLQIGFQTSPRSQYGTSIKNLRSIDWLKKSCKVFFLIEHLALSQFGTSIKDLGSVDFKKLQTCFKHLPPKSIGNKYKKCRINWLQKVKAVFHLLLARVGLALNVNSNNCSFRVVVIPHSRILTCRVVGAIEVCMVEVPVNLDQIILFLLLSWRIASKISIPSHANSCNLSPCPETHCNREIYQSNHR